MIPSLFFLFPFAAKEKKLKETLLELPSSKGNVDGVGGGSVFFFLEDLVEGYLSSLTI